MLEGLEGWQLLCLAGALWAGIVVVRELIDRRLERAQERLQGPQVARVYLNGIEIGSLPVAQHKAMLARARRDFGLYLSQAINTVLLGGRMLLYQLRQELEAPAHGVVSVLYWGVDPQGDEPRVHQA
ncbi:hypothetical protein SJR91_05270 [Aeromonas caviae]|uniref:hypothetical protein n=1 Tax=Aeromonas caviae TaxID=648 RepID=UPI0029D56BB3|nr:hypothetical protein [Aeromonas caviae]MDX7846990.1 hypothetical protein [Aeromonas caviae]